jgi:serine/threonine protein kinase
MFICREFCRFKLDKFLEKTENRTNYDLLKKIFVQCCEGIRYLHENGQLHGNIKPDNILLDYSYDSYLVDISVARPFVGYYKPVAGGGTHFLAPEIVNGQYELSADLWALAASFYAIMKDLAPYHERATYNIIKIMQDKIEAANYEPLTVEELGDETLIKVINDVLGNKPENRPSVDNCIDTLSRSFDYVSNYDEKVQAKKDQFARENAKTAPESELNDSSRKLKAD